MFQYVLIGAAFFALTAILVSTYSLLPKGNFSHHAIKFAIRYTEVLRTGKTLGKVFFWGVAVVILLFANALAGLVILIANAFAVQFSKRYAAAIAKPVAEQAPVAGEPLTTQ